MTYPTIRPALTLDFAKSKQLDPRITFSRSSSATYVDSDGSIKAAPDGVARFDHDPETGESLGLLIEESRTNSLTYSAEFDNAGWTKSRTTITANAVTAPDGTTTADKLIRNTDNNINVIYQTVSLSQTTYTLSIFAKKGEYNFCTLNLPNTQGWDADRYISVDLRDGSYAVSANAPTSTSVIAYPDGWYRISITHAASTTVTRGGYIEARSSSGYGSQAGDGTSGIYIWGAQLEAASFPTSYIPTAGSTVTRAADVASITGTNFSSWYNQGEGTVLMNQRNDQVDTDGYFIEMGGTSGSYAVAHSAHFISSTSGTGLQSRSYFSNSGSPSSLFYASKSSPGTIVYAYKESDYALGVDGTLSTTSQSSWNKLVPTVDNYLGLNRRRDNTRSNAALHISRLSYYPERVSNASLEALTA